MIFTIDVEDWSQSVLDYDNAITSRVYDSTLRLLDLLDQHQSSATFFMLGNVASKHPELVKRIVAAGHEIASHGYNHEPLFKMSPQQIQQDVSNSVKLLEDISGKKVIGYRAPDFSIREEMFEPYCEALAENGVKYDSSQFPMKVIRYGIEKRYSLEMFNKYGINEHYMSYMKLAKYKLPFFGGGYFRMAPYAFTKHFSKQLDPKSAVFYIHPYEVDPEELAYIKSTSQRIPLKWRLSQFIGRDTTETKLHRLLQDFEFTSFEKEYYSAGSRSIAQHTLSNIPAEEDHVLLVQKPLDSHLEDESVGLETNVIPINTGSSRAA